jgi:hypothetical protein
MTETPDYSVIKKDHLIEVRQYPTYITAQVDITDTTHNQAIYKGFRILAGYIFGNNTAKENISMTKPVQISQPVKIPMTKPVTIHGDGTYTVSFIMPSAYSLATLPTPEDPRIIITEIKSQTMAAIRFSGFFSTKRLVKARQRLEHWLDKQGYETYGDFVFARYNPPWVPWFLSRNEAMIQIKPVKN